MKINKNMRINTKYDDLRVSEKQKIDKAKEVHKLQKKIEISKTGKALSREINKVEDEKISARVEEIRSQVENGTYKVSSKEIADKMTSKMMKQNE